MKPEDNILPKFDVFVSYSSKEKAIADAVVAAHEGAGIRCWYTPRDIAPGADWAESITKAIHACSLMVLIFSKKANRSQRVIDEVNYAISQEKPLLPFRVETCNPTGALSLHLSSRHWLDAYESGWEAHIERLVKTVKINLKNTSDTIKISGGEAPAMLGGTIRGRGEKRDPLKIAGYLVGGLLVLSLLGILGWKSFGKVSESATPMPVKPTATDPVPTTAPTEGSPFTAALRGPISEDQFVLDPQVDGASSLTMSLFLTLTDYDIQNADVLPLAAESWSVSPDGRIYTFKLRSDIPWVQHTLGGDTNQVVDENGDPRFVTAADFVYAFRRSCDPGFTEGVFFGSSLIQGCLDVFEYEDPENIPLELFDAIGVEVVSDTELIIKLIDPSAVFLVTTSRFGATAVPSWAMEKYGEAWKNPGLMPTNGLFVIDEWVLGESIRLIRNELLPLEMQGGGNINTVELLIADDENEAYEMWLSNQIDYAFIPDAKLSAHLDQFPDQTFQGLEPLVFAVHFNTEHPPFDNVHLRRALSSGLNRAGFLHEILLDRGTPMSHYAPPGVFGAPPVNEVGVGDDQEFARSELTLAGYPQCQGLPKTNFFVSRFDKYAEGLARIWEQELECPEGTFNYSGLIWENWGKWGDGDLLIFGWINDIPDEEGWIGSLHCDGSFFKRSCNEIDDLILQVRNEISPSARIELYRQIEEAFFGIEGTFPIAPIYSPFRYIATHDWLYYVQSDYWGYDDFSRFSVDMDAKEAARGE